MVTKRFTHRSPLQRGTSLIEVLVTLVILSIGLLGLAGLQSRLQVSELEAYQRAQALILLDDMASRVAANRANAASYATDPITGLSAANCSSGFADAVEWCNALQGAAETTGGSNVGAMIGGRGCVIALPGGLPGEFLVTVAWQGLTPIAAPPAAVTCGQGSYGANDAYRRVVTTIVNTAPLT
jgi:type IV pilus assembly protein PilV